jgi:flavin-dependent dehydrogenase
VSRRLLDQTLFEHARNSGVDAREGTRVTALESTASGIALTTARGTVHARRLIAAWGRRSPLDGLLSPKPHGAAASSRPTHLGLKQHHRIADSNRGREVAAALETGGELIVFPGGYCGISAVEGGLISVCALIRSPSGNGDGSLSNWASVAERLSGAHPVLARRLQGLIPCADRPLLATAVWGFTARRPFAWDGKILLAGDAAGMIAPLCGDGQAMALQSGLLVGNLLAGTQRDGSEPAGSGSSGTGSRDSELLGSESQSSGSSRTARPWNGITFLQQARDYQRLWNRNFSHRMTLGRILQNAAFHPFLAEAMVATLRTFPPLTRYLARKTRG